MTIHKANLLWLEEIKIRHPATVGGLGLACTILLNHATTVVLGKKSSKHLGDKAKKKRRRRESRFSRERIIHIATIVVAVVVVTSGMIGLVCKYGEVCSGGEVYCAFVLLITLITVVLTWLRLNR
ncbi:putative integral membrane protein [Babesia bovis T2Bo]|uniref:putative integral membrane protein n=1 Tax=Babesia bovis T2Bo TaxID=484906 RepID=UPI001C35BC5B|nr:putative integral membrane protein [Babesia bovis T2Bo]KAG6440216.1 putative integral membrane protein [Babesia bovis T2Bo]